MRPLLTEDLERLLNIMHDMHEYAKISNWEELLRLDNERRALLRFNPAQVESIGYEPTADVSTVKNLLNLDSKSVDTSTPESCRKALVREISDLDKQIISTVHVKRQRLLDKNRDLSAQTQAKRQYAQTSSMS
ncbi:MAG: hypothetical protein AB8B97_03260 [Granulosicoccus sp.]